MIDNTFWKSKNILITGGAGFIGSNLAEKLVETEANIIIIDNLERGKKKYIQPFIDKVDFLKKDLRDKTICNKYLKNVDIVFHLASKVGGIDYYLEKPGEVIAQNNLIDSNVLLSSVYNEVEYFCFSSTAHVYPINIQKIPDAPPIKESQATPANPVLSYGWAKLFTEKQIEFLNKEGCPIKFSIPRLFGAYGKNQDIDLKTASAIPAFCHRAIKYPELRPFKIWGTGKETRSYCYIDDIIDGLIRAVENSSDKDILGPFNLGKEGRISIGELAKKVVEISGKDIEIIKDKTVETTIWGQAADCSKASKLLDGWTPKVTMDEGLKKIYTNIENRIERNK